MRRRIFAGCFNLPCTQVESSKEIDCHESIKERDPPSDFTSKELSVFTGEFSQENLVVGSMFGNLYRGIMSSGPDEITKGVSVKIFAKQSLLPRLLNELIFFQDPMISAHPNLVKLIGYCYKGDKMGVVYDVNPLDTLHNLIIRDDFKWLQRIKTALALARLLVFLHARKFPPYLIRSFDPAHIVFDQNLNPVVFEFGLLVGGNLSPAFDESDKMAAAYGCMGACGYVDPCVPQRGHAACTVKSDVYTFGGLLMNLISKRAVERKVPLLIVNTWALKEYKAKRSLVHQSFVEDPDFDLRDGSKIAKLAIQCINGKQEDRPEMEEVVKCLMTLRVMRK